MALLHLKLGDAEWNRHRHVIHRGTWNGNLATAAAAVAVLNIAAWGEVQRHAESMAERLVDGVNQEIEMRGIEACAHNSTSVVHIFIGQCRKCDRSICLDAAKSMPPDLVHVLNRHLLLNGVSLHRGVIGLVSAAHTAERHRPDHRGLRRCL